MKTVTDKESSSSKRHFHWRTKKVVSEEVEEEEEEEEEPTLLAKSSSSDHHKAWGRRKLPQVGVARLRSVVLAALGKKSRSSPGLGLGLGPRVVGTLFGSRRGHVHLAFQKDPGSKPALLIELATPISGLVKEMASGLVRIALECDREKSRTGADKRPSLLLLEENVWRTYCNGKKCGFATRRECGPTDWNVLKAVQPISMGAGLLPHDHRHDEVMYMRAKFERIVGSRDSLAFYMMNPDSNGAPELSVYLLRV